MGKKLLVVLTLSAALWKGAQASVITPEVTAMVTPTTYTLQVSVSITNKGDEAAYNVNSIIRIESIELSSKTLDNLPAEKNTTFHFSVPWKGKNPGKYFVEILVNYTDKSQYPFSAPSVAPFVWKEASTPQVFCNMKNVSIEKSSRLPLTFQNLSDHPLHLHFDLFLPRELHAASYERELSLSPYETREARIELLNQMGTDKSVYPIYTVIDYDENGHHFGTFSSSNLLIVHKTFFQRYGWAIAVLTLALTAVAVFQGTRTK